MQKTAQQLCLFGGSLALLVSLVVPGSLTLAAAAQGADYGFLLCWSAVGLAFGAVHCATGPLVVRDPRRAALMQILIGMLELLFFVPSAAFALTPPACIAFTLCGLCAFVSANLALRTAPAMY